VVDMTTPYPEIVALFSSTLPWRIYAAERIQAGS